MGGHAAPWGDQGLTEGGVVLRPVGGVCGREVWSVVSRVDLGLAGDGGDSVVTKTNL